MALFSPWRADFPALAVLEAQGQTYLDSAATAQKPQALIDALSGYYTCGAANVHRAQHQPAERATRAYEDARIKVAKWLNAACPTEIVFTRGATEALNLLAYGLEHLIEAGDEIVISALEHHANLLPWQQLAKRRAAKLQVLPIDASGRIDLAAATGLIGPRTRLLAVSQLSNVLGCWQPLDQLLHLAKAQGALTVVDGDVVGELVDRFFEVVTEQDVTVQLDRLDALQQTEQAAREPDIPADIGYKTHARRTPVNACSTRSGDGRRRPVGSTVGSAILREPDELPSGRDPFVRLTRRKSRAPPCFLLPY